MQKERKEMQKDRKIVKQGKIIIGYPVNTDFEFLLKG